MQRGITTAVCGLIIVLALPAAAQQRPEEDIRLRRSALKLMGHYFEDLSAMTKNKKPYNKEEAVRCATNLAALSKMPFEFFAPGTDKGETKARPEIWTEPEKWSRTREAMHREIDKLAVVARGDDLGALKSQVHATAQTCKSCHSDFLHK